MNDRLLRNMLPAQECLHDGGVVRWQARESCEGDTQGSHLARAKRRARARAHTKPLARESCSVHAGTHATHARTRTHALVPRRSWSVKELLKYNVKEGCRQVTTG